MRLCLALFICLLLFQIPGARRVKVTAHASAAGLSIQQEGAQSAELEESRQLNRKVVQLYQEGKLDEALALAKRVLEIREKALGKEHQLVVEALLNLGEVNLAKKLYRDALSNFERVLKSNEKLIGPDDASNVVVLDKLALLSYMTGDFGGTEKYYKRSLAISEKVSGPQSEEAAQSAYNLAEFYRFSRNWQKAEPLYQRALAIRDQLLPLEDDKRRRAAEGVMCLYYQSEQQDKLKAFEKMRAALYQAGGTDKQSTPGDVLNGKAISLPKPSYPVEAKATRSTGIVVVKVTIDESGKVVKAEDMCGGNYWLVKASTEAAYGARFSRTLLSGQPVKVTGLITYRFLM